ncbi:MAG: hypothetical protein J0H49_07920 [Acidobacteria bacterium]|nr:hypothetical protein [Acidobacteriota bacterium]
MAAPILQQGCMMMCPHGGQVTVIPSQTKVKLSGSPALLARDATIVAGCAFAPGPKPQPCVSVQWVGEAVRVKADGQPVLLQSSSGLCKSAEGIVQGTVIITGAQTRVSGE